MTIERRFAASCMLLLAFGFATAAMASCGTASKEGSIRNAVNSGATIIISSRGTFVEHPSARRTVGHLAKPLPLALKVTYGDNTAAPDEATLRDLVHQANARHKAIQIAVIAFAADPCAAQALAQARAASLRNTLVALGAPPSRLRIRALGGRSGQDRAEFRLA